MRQLIRISLTLLLIAGSSVTHGWKSSYKIHTVVIDAGHGGHDSGCLGASSKEKTIALAVALKLGKQIEEAYPEVKVVYTRKTDVFIPLHERAAIANQHKADLFICIHCNAGNKTAFGVETYVMGLHKTEDNLSVARRENAAILLEEDYKTQYEGFDPNSPEANIIFNLYQNQFLNQSLMFASNVQEQVVEYAGRHNRGVKQAGFLVLYKTAMPAVLIETGFLSHQAEEKYLMTEKGQANIATSIFRAFREYKLDIETPGSEEAPAISESTAQSDKIEKEPMVAVTTKETGQSKEDTVAEVTASVKSKPEVKPLPVEEKKTIVPEVYYTVQIGASMKPEEDNLKFQKIADVNAVKCDDGYTRYNIGTFRLIADARKKLQQLKSSYPDCFLSAYNGSKKITVAEAETLLKK